MNRRKGSFAINNNDASSEKEKLKSNDTISFTTAEENSLNKSGRFTHFNVKNIRFIPEAIEFSDALEENQLTEKITIQNVGRDPVYLKIGEPNSFIFQLKKPIRHAKLLSSGCSITRTVSYNYKTQNLVQSSQIPVHVNGQLLHYPIFIKKKRPKLEVQPRKLDFGVVNLGGSVTAITLTIFNSGNKRTKFEIDVKNNLLGFLVSPMQGTLKSEDFVNVAVEMTGWKEGKFYQELWIKSTERPIRVPVLVEIIRPHIEFVHPYGAENLVLISFRPTFIGTQRVESIVFRNHSVDDTLYIIVAEVNGEVQFLKNARSSTSSFRMFTLSSEEGFLKPFESRILNVVFCPEAEIKTKGWYHKEHEKRNETHSKHIVFFRIIRIHCLRQEELNEIEMLYDDFIAKDRSLTQRSIYKMNAFQKLESLIGNSQPPEDVLRFCLLGEAVEPDILIQPLSFEFGDLSLGQTENKVLRVTNNSSIAVKCTFRKICNLEITPKEVWLKSEKAQEFLLSLTPTCAGKFKTKMEVQILAESDVVSANKTLETIVVRVVTLIYNANDVPSIPLPKIGLGITPLLTDEVGLLKELIIYRDVTKLPYSAILGLKQGFKPVWMRKEVDQLKNVDNAMIALPNDRPRLFYSWPKDKICRTIFKGFFRYSPPEDLTYTLSPEGKIERKERRAIWADYISVLRELRSTKRSDPKEIEFCSKRDLCFKRHYNKENYKPNLNLERKIQASKKIKTFSEQHECFPTNTLVPLSPFFLFNVIVEPRLINFNTVFIEAAAQEAITVNNINPFPIGIQFMSKKSTVSVREKDIIIVHPSETKSVHVVLQANNLGLYLGTLNYTINGHHKFQINIYATINSKLLAIEDSEQSSKDPCRGMSDLALSRNPEPMKAFNLEKKFEVYFINGHIDLCDVSLNLPVKVKPIIRNAYHYDVCFEVFCSMPGVAIEPQEGVIKARSFLPLNVKLNFPVIMKFYFEVTAIINSLQCISVEITGNVVLPEIKIKPSEVVMRQICAYSLEAFVIRVENAGTTPAEMAIDFKNWPEFRVANGQSKFHLPPKKSSNIVINFEPIHAARYVLYLPIIINNILGPPMIQDRETEFVTFYTSHFEHEYESYGEVFITKNSKLKIPFVFVNGVVTQSLIRLSSPSVRFQLDSNSGSKFQPQNVEISNDFTDKVTFCIRNDDLGEFNGSPFNLAPLLPNSVEYRLKSMKTTLKRGEKLILKATFSPKNLGSYNVDIPIFVRGYSEGLVYNYIYMSGESEPRIHSKTSRVHFPPLPLGVECDAVLTICTKYYDGPDFIKCLICDSEVGNDDCEQQYLKTTWLDKPRVAQSGMTYSFQLRIQFQSSVPIALRKYILLFDSVGDYISILVTAIADNSSLTNHAFLIMKASKYMLIRDEPFQFKWKADEVFLEYPINKDDLKFRSNPTKINKKRGKKAIRMDLSFKTSSIITVNDAQNGCLPLIDKGPRLVMQTTNLMSGPTDLQYFKTAEKSMRCRKKYSNSSKINVSSPPVIRNETNNPGFRGSDPMQDSYPNFPAQDNSSRNYFEATLNYVERWIFEVVMKCDQYLSIPRSFQCLKEQAVTSKSSGNKETSAEVETEKDFLDFLEEIIGKSQKLPERPILNKNNSPVNESKALVSFYTKVLKLLKSEGCLLPHVRPEYLVDYENYNAYSQTCQNVELFSVKCEESEKSRNDENQANLVNKLQKKIAFNSSLGLSNGFWRRASSESLPFSLDAKGSLERVDLDKQQMMFSSTFLDGRLFKFRGEILDKAAFESKSTQAWLDTVIQIFRVFVLTKVVPKSTIPQVLNKKLVCPPSPPEMFGSCGLKPLYLWDDPIFNFDLTTPYCDYEVVEKTDKIMPDAVNLATFYNYGENSKSNILPRVDSHSSNVYSVQERILLGWLNHHLQVQKDILWKSENDRLFREKVLNNFDSDLSDSVALIAIVASHCPYIVSDYFKNTFPKPDTLDEFQWNAQKLIEAWNALSIGLTLNIYDLVKPNPVFMVIVVTHLYEFLPALHPHSLICFSAPLNSEVTRSLVLKNESQKRIVYRMKFFGDHEELFQLKDEPYIELQQSKTTNVRIKFTVRKIKRIFATLVLSTVCPTLAKHLTYYFEGEPSELPEHQKFTFNVPLYKVICSKVPVNPPYSDPASYEIWYTTKKPQYSYKTDIYSIFNPWSKIWKNKICRRLFLSKCEIIINPKKVSDILDVTIACFTKQKRTFWLLFRSSVSDFIILIEIKPKLANSFTISHCIKAWSPSAECNCRPECKLTSSNCPFFMNLMVPKRNNALWNALQTMFFKTLQPKEKAFWEEHFECNSGICLILWLLNPEEEEEVVDEFVQVLSTKVTYSLSLESNDGNVIIPSKIEISDVRERSDIAVPIHMSQNTSFPLNLKITMTSENEKEVRMLNVHVESSLSDKYETSVVKPSQIVDSMCKPVCLKESLKPWKPQKK